MAIAFIVGEQKPICCGGCPLWVKTPLGHPNYCKVGGEPTEEEIENTFNGRQKMYYHGYIDNIPKNCPLVEI